MWELRLCAGNTVVMIVQWNSAPRVYKVPRLNTDFLAAGRPKADQVGTEIVAFQLIGMDIERRVAWYQHPEMTVYEEGTN